MPTVSGSITAAGITAPLAIRRQPTTVDFAASGTYSGHVLYVEQSDNLSGGWRTVAGPYTTDDATLAVALVAKEDSYFRVRVDDVVPVTDAVTGTIAYSLTTRTEVVNELKDRDGNVIFRLTTAGVEVPGAVTVTGEVTGSNVPASDSGAGAAVGTGVVATESGNGVVNKTVLALTDHEITVTDALAYAGSQIYQWPAGRIFVLGCTVSLAFAVTSARAGTINDSAAMDFSIGSATASATTLATTMLDLLPKVDKTLDGAVAAYTTAVGAALAAAAQFDGTSTALKAFLNVSFPTITEIDADGTLTVTGTVTFHWINLGDY